MKIGRSRMSKTSLGRLENFRMRNRFGPSYPCVVCHQTLFRNQVDEFEDENLIVFLKKTCSERLCEKIFNFDEKLLFKIKSESNGKTRTFVDRTHSEYNVQPQDTLPAQMPTTYKNVCFICNVCMQYIKDDTLPPKAVANFLSVVPVPEEVHLKSYLEEALIARILLFIKIFSLKTSLMPAIKDKIVVIPLEGSDVLNTVETLPRLPSESGIIDIQWKRRLGQKNAHLQAKVDPNRIFNALQFLKNTGNELYQTVQTREEYEARCDSQDPDGFRLIFGDGRSDNLELEFIPEGAAEPILNLEEYLHIREELNDEEELQTNDPVRRFQIEYNTDVCMVQKYPEGMELDGVRLPKDTEHTFEERKRCLNQTLPALMPSFVNNNYPRPDNGAVPAKMPNIFNENPTPDEDTLSATMQNLLNSNQDLDSDTFSATTPNPLNQPPELDQNSLPASMPASNAEHNQESNQLHSVAPGEGKAPINLVYCQDWDAKAFPMLHPDGKNHLFDKRRKRKLRDQDYIKQRLFNVDPRWRRNTHWVFACSVFREKKDFNRNIDLAYKKGKKKINREGISKYHLDDPYSVFQSVLNTPAYHKKGKYEFMARLDNFGPFHIFFTVSCADYRWPENVAAILRERGIGLRYTFESNGTENYEVFCRENWMSMNDYIANEMDETLHTIFKKNVVTATRIYQQKVQALMQEIICNKNNPLSVKHYSIKLEFAGRGAGHNHGVLWLDIPQLERKVDMVNLQKLICFAKTQSEANDQDSRQNQHTENNQSTPTPDVLSAPMPQFENTQSPQENLKQSSDICQLLDTYLLSRKLGTDGPNNNKNKHRTFRYLKKLKRKSKIQNLNFREQKILKELQQIYPLYGLRTAMKKLNNAEEDVTEEDLATVITFIDIFSTVSLHPTIVGPIVAEIARQVNRHKHTKTCRKYLTVCRFKFPKLPSYKTVIARPANKSLSSEDKSKLEDKYSAILKKVQECLNDKEAVDNILAGFPKEAERNPLEVLDGRRKRIDALLNLAGLITAEEKNEYQYALEYSSSGYSIVMARDIDEIWVNSYNPEITRAWNGNTDFQICLDFYAIITYICEYFTKDDTGVIKVLVNTLKASDCEELKEKMILLMNTWIKNRQMGEAEAVYRLIPEFRFRDSDAKCVFVQTCPRSERSKILKNATEKPEYKNTPKVFVENDDREYVEQYDNNSKYERLPKKDIPILQILSFSQLIKIYEACWGKKSKKNTKTEENELLEEADVDLSATPNEETSQPPENLPATMPNLYTQSLSTTAPSTMSNLNNQSLSPSAPATMPNVYNQSLSPSVPATMPNLHTQSLSPIILATMPNLYTQSLSPTITATMPPPHITGTLLAITPNESTNALSATMSPICFELSDGESDEENDDKFHCVMAFGFEKGKGPELPKSFKLIDPYPGEPPFMRLRKKPAVLRFHKYKLEKGADA